MHHHHQPPLKPYVLIFNDMLKRHHALQVKFHPASQQQAKQQHQNQQPALVSTETAPPKPSVSLSEVSANSVVPTTTGSRSASVQSGSAQLEQAQAAPAAPAASTSTNITSSPSAPSYVKSATRTGPLSASFIDRSGLLKLPSMVRARNAPQPAAEQTRKTPPGAAPAEATPPTNRPAAKKLKRPVVAAAAGQQSAVGSNSNRGKDSAPNVSQTPRGVLGNSNSVGSPAAGGKAAKTAHTHNSMAKIIAEATPNAFKTLGPGFNAGAPLEKSITTKAPSGSTLGIMPSDYEHIFHAPSQIMDLPGPDSVAPKGKNANVTHKQARKK